ncbi:XRE family transcriptional regulator [Mucilaginibacter terrenus]|uniref:XRE family transcriptional regulator n=1 Tax=Mucilaginibacter terrenus TaxID=2482727 RepID=A0A3E2NVX3_9SPHI|nr:helix-turn-helix transcriptional regulator [Mucilaginibacter terrenus]RFZ85107.1 XRE family transcriptional regulator [Mucilaginibacter terrenus]
MSAVKRTPQEQEYQEVVLKRLGERIRELRIAAGEDNYEKFAFKHNLSRAQVWRYENGEDLKLSTLVRVLRALNITLEEFFKGFDL